MFTPIGALAAEGQVSPDLTARRSSAQARRTHQPIRRKSHLKGREGVFWRPTNKREVAQIVLAARRYDLLNRQPGDRNGPLGHVALELLDYLSHLVDFRTGRLDPSLEYLMAKLHRSKDAIHRALQALRAHGFIDWLRRYVPTGRNSGPQVQQTSNAYRLSLPARAKAFFGRLWGAAPTPDDFAHAQAARAAERAAQEATLSNEEYARHIVEDDDLAAVLVSLAKARSLAKERESAKRSESRSSF